MRSRWHCLWAVALLLACGNASGWAQPAFVELSWVAAGDGLVIYGKHRRYNLGAASAAADLNGDGYTDLALGASGADPVERGKRVGEIHVLLGPLPSSGSIDLAMLDREDVLVLRGLQPEDGASISSKSGRCDVNGDGLHELLGVASGETPGQTFVLFGARAFPPSIDLSLDGEDGFIIRGVYRAATAIACAGDVNGDGFDDIIIGDRFASPGGVQRGEVYLVFGRPRFPPVVELSELTPGTGFTLAGNRRFDEFGWSVAGAGDVNGDGLAEVLIGAPAERNQFGARVGRAYLLYGRTDFDLDPDGRPTRQRTRTVLRGNQIVENAGAGVAAAGDVNADGYDDFLVGAWTRDIGDLQNAGVAYVVFGGPVLPTSLRLEKLNGDDGFAILGGNRFDSIGSTVVALGDVNGDGIDDLGTAATGGIPWGKRDAGQAYVVFGREEFPRSFVSTSLDGTDGYMINGELPGDNAGRVLSSGDLNADGRRDLVVGAARVDRGGVENVGAVYIVFEQTAPTPAWVIFPPRPPIDPP